MKIYTKTGDAGSTMLIGGLRVPKSDIRIEAYGTVDELNAYIGLICDQQPGDHYRQILKQVQNHLFIMGSNLAAAPEKSKMKLPELIQEDIHLLEEEIDRMQDTLKPLSHFILPGGSTLVSYCHIARCICRRAERITVQLAQESTVEKIILIYLNRLSDYLFVLSRKVAQDNQIEETAWFPRGKQS
ncbi:cob(I)yrinic acid a,c-diamide adenosyltransferase [Arcticibacter sp.]|uniref:cob(I)yrinic acid a,c-diamide adenosyltransferase n=1 Tax=Arcticibacter sp. TaxID=1872630 RepID=UPI00388D5F4C